MRTPSRLRSIALVASALYVAALALIAFWPTPVDRPVEVPIRRAVDWSRSHGAEAVTYPLIESLGNVALFVPVGFLLVLILGASRWWLSLMIGVALSSAIELTQHVFLSGRFSTVDDVLANSIGTAVGTVLGVLLLLGIRLVKRGAVAEDKLGAGPGQLPRASTRSTNRTTPSTAGASSATDRSYTAAGRR